MKEVEFESYDQLLTRVWNLHESNRLLYLSKFGELSNLSLEDGVEQHKKTLPTWTFCPLYHSGLEISETPLGYFAWGPTAPARYHVAHFILCVASDGIKVVDERLTKGAFEFFFRKDMYRYSGTMELWNLTYTEQPFPEPYAYLNDLLSK